MTHPRLDDPAEHFPYKHDEASALLEKNPPAGPNGKGDKSFRVEDFTSQAIIDASDDYVNAQAAYLADDSADNLAAYHEARDALIAARQEHRAERGPETVTTGSEENA